MLYFICIAIIIISLNRRLIISLIICFIKRTSDTSLAISPFQVTSKYRLTKQ